MFLVTIEVKDPKLHAVEFVLKDEAHKKWFKHNNNNFQIDISKQDVRPSNASIPPELVEQKTYLLWESKGRPRNSPEQAKQDYNYAMRELQDQLAKGIFISELQNSLQAKNNEKADYKKTDGLLNSPSFRRHDVSEWLNKYPESHEKATKLSPPTMLNLFEKSISHLDGGVEVLRHKLNDSNTELTVFQGSIREENHMLFVVNMKGNLVLHCGIVKPSSGEWLIDIFTEELIRGGSDACLSVLLNHLDPVVRKLANLGCWQIISSVEVCGFVTVVDELFKFQSTIYKRPTIIIANRVSGDEEIPDGVVAVLTPDMPDILSHISVRARNSQVGAKSRNLRYLKGKLPSWVHVPTSIAIPFGVFETILMLDENKDEAKRISSLSRCLDAGDLSKLREIQKCVLQLKAPAQLINELKNKMKLANISWPGDEGEKRGKESWEAIKKVWDSKWNERAYISSRKAKVNHQDICMAVLIQEIVCADYAFVIHTKNPSSGDSSEIYAEVVKGLGESLVGAYPGRAMSFVTKKSNWKAPKVTGYPSKQIVLYIKRKSIIFRSDSNGEDLEGYAGAGLYDSVPLDREDKVVLDYSTDKLIVDRSYQYSILSKIAEVGKIIESLYGSAQDIEGVVKDGQIYVVQARPQV